MHEIDKYGRIINKYGHVIGLDKRYYPALNFPKENPCIEIDYPEPVQDKKDYKYVLIRRL